MIRGAPRTVMIAFFALGVFFVIYSSWALYITDIPQQQFKDDPRFEEEYAQYHEWLTRFGFVGVGVVFGYVGRNMSGKRKQKVSEE